MPLVHVVKQGECLSVIARAYGFADYKTVYQHPDNADLRKKRPNPNILRPGDRVSIPEREVKTVEKPTGASHTFRVKGQKRMLRLALLDAAGEPLNSVPYELDTGVQVLKGTTDGDGKLEVEVAASATDGTLTIADRVLVLRYRHMNPVDPHTDDPDGRDWSGVQSRLKNLGYATGPADGRWGPRTRAAIALFQHDHGLDIDGKPTDATLHKLEAAHGC